MVFRRHNLLPTSITIVLAVDRWSLTFLSMVPHPFRRHLNELRLIERMAEIRYAIPLTLLSHWEDDTMHGAFQQATGPVGKQVADVDEDGKGLRLGIVAGGR